MTTAARPTWAPAKGGEDQGGARYFGPSRMVSGKDIASHTELKERCVLVALVRTNVLPAFVHHTISVVNGAAALLRERRHGGFQLNRTS
eukprot:1184840-Prorocentrum_minimum.AAC.4